MFHRIIFAFCLFGSTLGGCSQSIEQPITPVPPVITDQDQCITACNHLRDLKCEEGEPIVMQKKCLISAECDSGQVCSTVSGDKSGGTCLTPCETFCRNVEDLGVWLSPGCVSLIVSCDKIEACALPPAKK